MSRSYSILNSAAGLSSAVVVPIVMLVVVVLGAAGLASLANRKRRTGFLPWLKSSKMLRHHEQTDTTEPSELPA
jgi:hypothetical protein